MSGKFDAAQQISRFLVQTKAILLKFAFVSSMFYP